MLRREVVFVFLMSAQATFFADHHGVASRRELLNVLGFSKGQVERMIANGILFRVHPGVYRLSTARETWRSCLRAAAVSVDGVASHQAAAVLWEIDGFERAALHVTMWESKRLQREGVIVHLSRQMHHAEAIEIDGIMVTGIERTVLDLFAVLGPKRREQLLDSVIRQGLVDVPGLYEVIARHSVQGRNGVGVLRQTLDFSYDASVIPDSRWNRMVGQLLTDHGVGGLTFEHEVFDDRGGLVGRLDLALAEFRLGIELDSIRWHFNRSSFVNDPRRRNRLQLAGWTIINFTWADYVDNPGKLVATVHESIRQARRRKAS